MRILIGSNVNWWNAEAAYAAEIAHLLRNAGHIVYVITQEGSLNEKNLKKLGLTLVTDVDLNTKNPYQLIISYKKLKKLLIEEDIEFVNPHQSEGFPLFVLAVRSLKRRSSEKSIPVIRTRGTTRPIKKHWLSLKMNSEWTNYFITAGNVVKKRLLKNVKIHEEKVKTIYYPVESPKLPLRPFRDYREEFSIKTGSHIFGIVGRIRPVKGQRILLQSFSKLLSEFPDLILLIIYRDTSDLDSSGNGFGITRGNVANLFANPAMVLVDSPSSTSELTYTVYMKVGSGTATSNTNNAPGRIIAIEIGA